METPYLEKEIQYLESIKKSGEISFYSSKKLEEYKEAKKQLSLCSVLGQSEQLCEGLHATDFNGKCFKCGEQVFVKEETKQKQLLIEVAPLSMSSDTISINREDAKQLDLLVTNLINGKRPFYKKQKEALEHLKLQLGNS